MRAFSNPNDVSLGKLHTDTQSLLLKVHKMERTPFLLDVSVAPAEVFSYANLFGVSTFLSKPAQISLFYQAL